MRDLILLHAVTMLDPFPFPYADVQTHPNQLWNAMYFNKAHFMPVFHTYVRSLVTSQDCMVRGQLNSEDIVAITIKWLDQLK